MPKSKIMRIKPKQNQPIKISNIELEDVNKFVYLGATISQNDIVEAWRI